MSGAPWAAAAAAAGQLQLQRAGWLGTQLVASAERQRSVQLSHFPMVALTRPVTAICSCAQEDKGGSSRGCVVPCRGTLCARTSGVAPPGN